MIKAAIFDADGTLLDSMHIWSELGDRFLRSINITPEKGLSEILYDMSIEQGCLYLQTHYKIDASLSQIRESILAIIENFYVHEVNLKPGVRDFLDRINLPSVIATSGDKDLLTAALIRNEIDKYFAGIFTCSELETDKNEPKIFLKCADFLGLKPENIIVFEDSLFALKTAKDSGFIIAGVKDVSSQKYEHEAKIIDLSDYYVTDWREFHIS
ncbi:MAG: HAD family phosphatase [Synergistaceae bacterium]|nr:HAD family phosphatase [Synergistaceae bacterium]